MTGYTPVMKRLILPLLIATVVALANHWAFRLEYFGSATFALTLVVPYVLLAAAGVVYAKREGVLSSWLSPRWGDFSLGFAIALVSIGGAWGFTKVVATQGTPRESWIARIYLQLGSPGDLKAHMSSVALIIITMAIAEELVWRGLVPLLLEPLTGSRRAWIFSAVLYALAHLPTAWNLRDPAAGLNPMLPLGALGVGLLWGATSRYFGRLTPNIIGHAFFGWAFAMMFRLWGPGI